MGGPGEPYTMHIAQGTGRHAGASGTCRATVALSPNGPFSQIQEGEITCDLTVPESV